MKDRHRRSNWFLVVFLLLSLSVGAASFAQDVPDGITASTPFDGVSAGTLPEGTANIADVARRSVVLDNGNLLVMVELADQPAVTAFIQAGGRLAGPAADAAAQAQQAVVQQAQAAFIASLPSAGINAQMIAQTSYLVNIVSLGVPQAQLDTLANLSGVRNVFPVRRYEREDSTSVPLVGAPDAWNSGLLGGAFTGQGSIIAVVDDGLDYTHRAFGGDGNFPVNPDDRDTIADGGFPSAKVIGGFDFVGDDFVGDNLPVPDPDPIGCPIPDGIGHGTSVAGVAAGFGLNADGTTYVGGDESVPYGTLRLGPGVAPEASLMGFQIFGCAGFTTDVQIVQAMDAAVSGEFTDGQPADVINMSLGAPHGYGGSDPSIAPVITATNNATAAGVVVVASAGNSGDTFYVTGTPAATGGIISVASTFDGVYDFQGVEFSGLGGGLDGVYPANASVGNPATSVVGPLPLFMPANDACSASDYASFPAGHAAYINWTGNCGSNGLYAAALGAAGAGGNVPLGMVVVDTDPPFQGPGSIINLSCGTPTPNMFPCYSVSNTTGQIVEPNLGTAMVTFDPDLTTTIPTPNETDTASDFTSRGPRVADTAGGIKPDLAAPGDNFLTTPASGSGDGVTSFGGTSGAAPHVAGAAALLRSNPTYAGWTVPQIKALLMNTANNDVFYLDNTTGPRLAPQAVGTGRLTIPDALSSAVIAFNALNPELVGVSWGVQEGLIGVPRTIDRTVRVQNLSATAATYDLSLDTINDTNAGFFSIVGPTTITVAPFSSVTVTVRLTVDIPFEGFPPSPANPPNNFSDPSIGIAQGTDFGPLPRHHVSEEGALLLLTPTSGATVPLRVPLYAAPRVAASMAAAESPLELQSVSGLGTLELAGQEVDTGGSAAAFPEDVFSLVSSLRHMITDPLGDVTSPLPEFDIEHVGIASNFFNGGNTGGEVDDSTQVFVGVSTAADWTTLNGFVFIVNIDVNQDGFNLGPDDYQIFVSSPGNTTGATGPTSDVYFTFRTLASEAGGALEQWVNGVPASPAFGGPGLPTYALNNNVVMLPFFPGFAADPGDGTPRPMLPPGDTDFNFFISTFEFFSDFGTTVDQTDVMYFDLANPVIDTHLAPVDPTLPPVWDDTNGNNILFDYDLTLYPDGAPVPPGLLLLHHHNRANVQNAAGNNFRRAEVVPLDTGMIEADISVSKTGPASVLPNDPIQYSITVDNPSDRTTANITMTDVLPPQIAYGSLSVSGSASATCTHDGAPIGGTVTCTAQMNPLESFTVDIDATVEPNVVGELVNTADVVSDILDPDLTNNSAAVVTQVPPGAATLISPLGTILETSPLFSWNEVFGADWYYFELYDDMGNLVTAVWFDQTAVCGSGVCTADPGVNLVVGNYTWFVQTWNPVGGFGPFSDPGNFAVAVLPGQPTLIAPLGTITDTMPSFSWNEVAGANGYSVWVSANNTFEPGGTTLLNEFYLSADVCSGSVCEIAPGLNLSGGTYNWWVRAWSTISGFGPWSNEGNFAVAATPSATTLIAPLGAINNPFPLYSWTMEQDVAWYYLWVSYRGNTLFTQWYQAGDICDPMAMTCMVDIGLQHLSGPYTWWVQTYSNTGGFGPWSLPGNFTVATPPGPATPIAPFGTIAQTQPSFSWFTPLEATWFQLWVSGPSASLVLNDVYERTAVCTGDTCIVNPGLNLTDGAAYRWWVRTWNAEGGFGPWTGAVDFNIDTATGTIAQPGVIAPTAPPPVDAVPGELPGGIFGQ
ncbi:MAG: S8 family serine peptidase [Chloroflexi bacterium]|nr:S8 family serine peptidase [Chloroflexota bacterium]